MKAAVFEDVKKIKFYEDYPKPEIGPDDALVRVKYCGVCGSDIHNFKNKMYQTPLIMGHELSGIIEEVGSNVEGFNVGDKVSGINVKLDLNEGNLGGLGIFEDGGFAEYVRIPKRYLFHIPSNISLKGGVMIESFANAMRAMKISQIGLNERIMIIGGGNIGLCFLNALKVAKNPEYIIVIEPHQFLREKAVEMGANDSFPPSKSKIKRFIRKKGAPSYIFDCVGVGETLMLGVDLIERGGTILIEGIHKGTVEFPLFMINSKEITLHGSLGHDRDDILAAIKLISEKNIEVEKLISKEVSLEDLHDTFMIFLNQQKRDFIKIIAKM
ncbi:MAG: alcohol dehydrogenase catalytic domain-containing protein [Candidatus Lokiarchaeota archaeon]|nr:alcohol dehydrogenase catalytic domain-containing protein [Candidatus Lokiarchaeota archaeon]MBD3201232.1 alcohol dehydrogenase catalytic domain-containing protein [Candidatus Lokiarchaeota archaeon]